MSEELLPQRRHYRIIVFFRMPSDQVKVEFPSGFQIREINGYGIGGIVLRQRRPLYSVVVPTRLVTSQTALHFLNAIEVRGKRVKTGVLVMRYDTSSRLNAWIRRGRWRNYHHARFEIAASPESIRARCDSDDQLMHVKLRAVPRPTLSPRSIFHSMDQLHDILETDLRSFRLTRPACCRRGLAPPTIARPQVIPLHVTEIESSLFRDPRRFLAGAAEFDSAYWLREDVVAWCEQRAMRADIATDIATA